MKNWALILAAFASMQIAGLMGCATPRDPAISDRPWMLRDSRSDIDAQLQQADEVFRQGDILSADLLYRELVEREPMNPRVLNNAAHFLVESGGDYARAEALIMRALTIEPSNPRYLDTLGYLLLESWRFVEAVQPLERAHARADQLDRDEQRLIVRRLVTVYQRTGQDHLVRQVKSAYLEKDPDFAF